MGNALVTASVGGVDYDALSDAIGNRDLEAGITYDELFRIIGAVLAGSVSGAGTGVETFKGLDGTTDRVVSTNDTAGNRTNVVVDGT
jgi:hypothetical protein